MDLSDLQTDLSSELNSEQLGEPLSFSQRREKARGRAYFIKFGAGVFLAPMIGISFLTQEPPRDGSPAPDPLIGYAAIAAGVVCAAVLSAPLWVPRFARLFRGKNSVAIGCMAGGLCLSILAVGLGQWLSTAAQGSKGDPRVPAFLLGGVGLLIALHGVCDYLGLIKDNDEQRCEEESETRSANRDAA